MTIRAKGGFEMFDFTEGSTWFVAGFGATVLVFALVLILVFVARKVEHR